MADHRFQREPEIPSRPLPGSGTVRRAGSPLVELALVLQRQAGNRSFTELVGGSVGSTLAPGGAALPAPPSPAAVQREPCSDCPDPDPPTAPGAALPEPDTQG